MSSYAGVLKSMYDTAVTEITKQTEELSDTVMGASEATVMVRKATNSDPWGPSGTDMLKIANLSQRHTEGRQIMDAVWQRLTNTGSGKNWRNVYKALLLLEYLLKNGAERISGEVRGQIFDLKQLTRFQYVDDEDVDRGLSVRERSKQIIELVHDTNRLKEERKVAHQNRSKYTESISSGGGGFGSGSTPGHYASQSHFKKNSEYDRERYDDDWEEDKGKRYNGPPSKSTAFSSDDDEFTVPKNVPKKEAWNPGAGKTTAPVFDDDDDWKDFDKKVQITPKPTAAPVAQAPPAFAAVAPAQQTKPAARPAEVNPLDSLGVDLLGTGSLLTPEKPLPNLFGAPEPTTTTGGLPNLFGAPEPAKPAGGGNQLPNIFGNNTPAQSTTNFGTGTFGTLGGGAPASNAAGGFGTTPGFGTVPAAKPAGVPATTGFGAAPAGGFVAAPGYGYGVPVAGAAPGYPAGYVYAAAPAGAYPPGTYAYPAAYPATGY